MDNKVEWVDTKPLNIEKSTTFKIDELQEDILANVYAIKRITNKFWHKQRTRTLKFIAALCYLRKLKYPRFMQKATRKNLTRRKYGKKEN